uniref:COP9 signalosome complex subunit 6 n=1 Tax=Panagrellus redivivus TaxID=6233 RepID=A0A7E4VR45_PANRE
MDKNTAPCLNVFIHPLVTLSISDQWTRARMNGGTQRIIGLIAGKRDGHRIEITNSAELMFTTNAMELDDSNSNDIDEGFYVSRVELLKEMYPLDNVLGWYFTHTANCVDENDKRLNRQFAQLMQIMPIIFKFDAETLSTTGQLNQAVYESYLDAEDDTNFQYRPLPIQFETEASELIGLEHMASFSAAADYQHTTSAKQLMSLVASMKVFLQRLKVSEAFVRASIAGEVPWDEAILGQILKLRQRLKALELNGSSARSSDLITSAKQVVNVAGLAVLQDEVYNIASFLPNISVVESGNLRHVLPPRGPQLLPFFDGQG